MNSVLKGQIIQAIRDPRNKAIEGDFVGNIDYVRYLLKIGNKTVFDITDEPGSGHKIGIKDEWDIVLELRRAVDYHKYRNDKTPLTPQEKSIIDFLQQKQR